MYLKCFSSFKNKKEVNLIIGKLSIYATLSRLSSFKKMVCIHLVLFNENLIVHVYFVVLKTLVIKMSLKDNFESNNGLDRCPQ